MCLRTLASLNLCSVIFAYIVCICEQVAACPTVLLLTIRRIIYTQRRWLTLTHFMSELKRLTFDGEQLCISIMCLTKTNSKRKLHMHSVMSRLLKAFTQFHFPCSIVMVGLFMFMNAQGYK